MTRNNVIIMVTVAFLMTLHGIESTDTNEEKIDDTLEVIDDQVNQLNESLLSSKLQSTNQQQSTISINSTQSKNFNHHKVITCSFDKNATRGDFICSCKTCYDFTSGKVTFHRIYCERVTNRIERLDEKGKKLLTRIKRPFEDINGLIKTSLRDWAALQTLEYLGKQMRIA